MLSFTQTAVIAGLVWAGAGLGRSAIPAVEPISPPLAVITAEDPVEPPTPEERAALGAFFQEKKVEIAAAVLGLSVEEYETARAEGQSIKDLAVASGLSGEELRQTLKSQLEAVLDEAVSEGLMSEEQAQFVRDHPRRFFGRWWWARPLQRSAARETLAGALGITTEALETALEDGKRLPELIDDLGLEPAEVRQDVKNSQSMRVLKAVEEGRLTAEQGARMLWRIHRPQRPVSGQVRP